MSQQQQWNENGDEDVQMPLNTGSGGDPLETYGDSSSKPKVNASTLALFGAFALAIVVLYLLGMQNKPRAASAEQMSNETKVKNAITEMLENNGKTESFQSLFKDTDKLVAIVYAYLGGSNGQKLPQLMTDPFDDGPVSKPTITDQAVDLGNTNPSIRQVAEEFTLLKVESIMYGARSVAVVSKGPSKKMATTGSKIGSFTVSEIQKDRVILTHGEMKFELKLSRPAMDGQ